MKFTSSVLAAALLAAYSVNTEAFTTRQMTAQSSTKTNTNSALFVTPEDLTNAMAKAHEEKIRAMKDVEDKKNAEIKALKSEMESLKESQQALPAAPAMVPSTTNFSLDITNMNKEQLAGRLVTYQQFMSRYIVEAQEQKRKAVLAAEAAVIAKYEQKLQLYQAKEKDAATPAIKPPGTQLYEGRNANVAAAAKAGKSRWGDMEVKKAQGKSPAVNGVQVNGAANVPVVEEKVDPNSIAILTGSNLYYHRNQMVAAAGAAGKSRWGEAEVKKATTEVAEGPPSLEAAPASAAPVQASTAPSVPIEVTPEIEAADHGLRNDGGVGGPSLAERVNLGASLLSNGSAAPAVVNGQSSAASTSSLYDSRNVRVAAAAAAGKSRWGNMENERAKDLSSSAFPSAPAASAAVAAVEVPPEVEAADHGLRADGGVGGPSLAQRVNLGASLLGP